MVTASAEQVTTIAQTIIKDRKKRGGDTALQELATILTRPDATEIVAGVLSNYFLNSNGTFSAEILTLIAGSRFETDHHTAQEVLVSLLQLLQPYLPENGGPPNQVQN